MEKYGIGQPVRRKEDVRFLTGSGTFIDDISPGNLCHGVVLRSSHAHAKILSIDTGEAETMPGVLAIITPDEWMDQDFQPLPSKSAVNKKSDGSPMNEPARHCLAIGRVRYVGEPVVFIVAETEMQARDAAEF